MTRSEFSALCGESTIDPAIVLESENAVEAIRADDIEELRRILREEF
jgi:hypothetical protein